jgi:hypothetical protein
MIKPNLIPLMVSLIVGLCWLGYPVTSRSADVGGIHLKGLEGEWEVTQVGMKGIMEIKRDNGRQKITVSGDSMEIQQLNFLRDGSSHIGLELFRFRVVNNKLEGYVEYRNDNSIHPSTERCKAGGKIISKDKIVLLFEKLKTLNPDFSHYRVGGCDAGNVIRFLLNPRF